MKRPLALNILMWFCGAYATGAVLGIVAVLLDLGKFVGGYSIGGVGVDRSTWLHVAAPLVGIIAILMALTAVGLKRHRRYARVTWMVIWPLIIAYAIASAALGRVSLSLCLRAIIDATVVGGLTGWLLFGSKQCRAYFLHTSAG